MNLRLIMLSVVLLLSACATPHVIELHDGKEIVTADKPGFNKREGFYTYETLGGNKEQVNKDDVKTIREY